MKYSLFKYGTGVLYGVASSITSVSPDTGPSIGGNEFVMEGIGFDPRHWDDQFTAAVLDPVKWVDISAGTGVVTTALPNLMMSTGFAPGSVAGIESVANWVDVQGEIRCTIPRYVLYPTSTVNVLSLQLYVNATNYCQISITLGANSSAINLLCEVWRNGVVVDTYTAPWTVGTSMFKILRWKTDVYFIVNGTVVLHSHNFVNTPATFRIYGNNNAAAYDAFNTMVEWFYYRPFAVFENEPVHDTVIVSDYRLRGNAPPSIDNLRQSAAYAGLVDTSVVANGMFTLNDSYLYYYVDGLTVIDNVQQETKLSLINDAQVVTPAGYTKGLGGGY
jgi:hypothetical protein